MTETGPEYAGISSDADTLVCSNLWTVSGVGPLRASLDELVLPRGDIVAINGSAITAMDTAGAWLLVQLRGRLEAAGQQVVLEAFRPEQNRLIQYIAATSRGTGTVLPRRASGPRRPQSLQGSGVIPSLPRGHRPLRRGDTRPAPDGTAAGRLHPDGYQHVEPKHPQHTIRPIAPARRSLRTAQALFLGAPCA